MEVNVAIDSEAYFCHTNALVNTLHGFNTSIQDNAIVGFAGACKVRASKIDQILRRCFANQVIEEIWPKMLV